MFAYAVTPLNVLIFIAIIVGVIWIVSALR